MAGPAAYRCSMIFNYISGAAIGTGWLNLKGGWSESVYSTSFSPATVASFRNFAQARASLLPASAYIAGFRFQGIDPSSGANTQAVNYPGPGNTVTNAQDLPQSSLLLRVAAAGRTNVRSMRITAIPDAQLNYGEWNPGGPYQIAMGNFLTQLSGWNMRVQDLTQTVWSVASITQGGLVTTVLNSGLAIGQYVKIKRTLDAFGNYKGGKYQITGTPAANQLQLANWNYGASTGGVVQQFVIVYPVIVANESSISRAVVRKVGRPSLGYRGRRSKRRA